MPPVFSSINGILNRVSFGRFLRVAKVAELTSSASSQVSDERLVGILQIVGAGGEFAEDFRSLSATSSRSIDLLPRRQVEVLWRENTVVFYFCFFCLQSHCKTLFLVIDFLFFLFLCPKVVIINLITVILPEPRAQTLLKA